MTTTNARRPRSRPDVGGRRQPFSAVERRWERRCAPNLLPPTTAVPRHHQRRSRRSTGISPNGVQRIRDAAAPPPPTSQLPTATTPATPTGRWPYPASPNDFAGTLTTSRASPRPEVQERFLRLHPRSSSNRLSWFYDLRMKLLTKCNRWFAEL